LHNSLHAGKASLLKEQPVPWQHEVTLSGRVAMEKLTIGIKIIHIMNHKEYCINSVRYIYFCGLYLSI
jgi:hypothetical protein